VSESRRRRRAVASRRVGVGRRRADRWSAHAALVKRLWRPTRSVSTSLTTRRQRLHRAVQHRRRRVTSRAGSSRTTRTARIQIAAEPPGRRGSARSTCTNASAGLRRRGRRVTTAAERPWARSAVECLAQSELSTGCRLSATGRGLPSADPPKRCARRRANPRRQGGFGGDLVFELSGRP